MEVSRVSFAVFVAAVAVLVVFSPVASAQMSPSSAPAPASDGVSLSYLSRINNCRSENEKRTNILCLQEHQLTKGLLMC